MKKANEMTGIVCGAILKIVLLADEHLSQTSIVVLGFG